MDYNPHAGMDNNDGDDTDNNLRGMDDKDSDFRNTEMPHK